MATYDVAHRSAIVTGAGSGIGGEQSLIGDYSLDGRRGVIEVHLNAVFYGLKAQLPSMAENGGGSIVNMASILGSVGFATSSACVTAKHGLLGLTQNAALEYGAKKVRTNAVGPGFIHTSLEDSALDASTQDFLAAKHALGRLGTPQAVSGAGLLPRLGCRVLRLRQLPPRRWRVRGAVAVVVRPRAGQASSRARLHPADRYIRRHSAARGVLRGSGSRPFDTVAKRSTRPPGSRHQWASSMLRGRTRRLLALVGVAYVAACLSIGFWASHVDAPFDGALGRVLVYLHTVGIPDVVDYRFIERGANVLLFVPLGALAAAQLRWQHWWIALGMCFALSGVIELGQALLLPGRYASWSDILTDSVGAGIGVRIMMLMRRRTPGTTSR